VQKTQSILCQSIGISLASLRQGLMCLASNSRVSTECRSPEGEPSDVFISSHAASNADAKIFVVSASTTLFVTSERIGIKVVLQLLGLISGKWDIFRLHLIAVGAHVSS